MQHPLTSALCTIGLSITSKLKTWISCSATTSKPSVLSLYIDSKSWKTNKQNYIIMTIQVFTIWVSCEDCISFSTFQCHDPRTRVRQSTSTLSNGIILLSSCIGDITVTQFSWHCTWIIALDWQFGFFLEFLCAFVSLVVLLTTVLETHI